MRFKLIFYNHNSLKITSKTWGISKKLLKIWCKTIIENYNIWGRHLERNTHKTGNNETNFYTKKLFTTDTKLLQNNICRYTHFYHRYITDSNSTKIWTQKSNILHLIQELISSTNSPKITIQHKVHSWPIHPVEETSHFQVTTTLNSYTPADCLSISTDGNYSL